MKNFVLVGRLWKRAIEFANEASADRYIAQRYQGIEHEKCSAEELDIRFAGSSKTYLDYNNEQENARGMLVFREF